MKKLKGAIDVAHLIMAIVFIVILGALLPVMTDFSIGLNDSAARNGSAAIQSFVSLLPVLIILAVVVSFVAFATHDG